MNIQGTCIFCRNPGPFNRIEHPIPESLGNDDEILPSGFVCDACNQYFGTKLECEVLSIPPWSVERTAAAIKTKKQRLPKHIDKKLRAYSSGFWDHIIIESDNPALLPIIECDGGNGLLLLEQSKRSDELIGRFLLKIGLELLVKTDIDVRDSRFDKARLYARFGRHIRKWELAYGLFPNRKNLLISKREDAQGVWETRQIYQYGIGQMDDGRIIFCFVFINHVFAVCLTDDRLGSYLESFNIMNCFTLKSNVHY